MKIGVPKEIKDNEFRVAVVPAGVRELVAAGHHVLVEAGAGIGAGFDDAAYVAAGAAIVPSAEETFAGADLIVKVKEPQAVERKRLRAHQVLFTYLHLAPDPAQADDLAASGATCIAYETVTAPDGSLPLLTPMSEVAGRMAIQVGASALERPRGGSGVLLGGVPGVAPGHVAILGAGVSGSHAAAMALGLGARVTIVDRSLPALRRAVDRFGTAIEAVYSTRDAIDNLVRDADLIVGTVLIPGETAPKLITRRHLAEMRKGSVIVDVSVDQGGCVETTRATTHAAPTYIVDGIVHYCVANMPGGVARTSTLALTNATLPHVLAIANKGAAKALTDDPHLRNGLNVHAGRITHDGVARSLGKAFVEPLKAIAA